MRALPQNKLQLKLCTLWTFSSILIVRLREGTFPQDLPCSCHLLTLGVPSDWIFKIIELESFLFFKSCSKFWAYQLNSLFSNYFWIFRKCICCLFVVFKQRIRCYMCYLYQIYSLIFAITLHVIHT